MSQLNATNTSINEDRATKHVEVTIDPKWMESAASKRAFSQALKNIASDPNIRRLEVVPCGAIGPAADIIHDAINWPVKPEPMGLSTDASGFRIVCKASVADPTLLSRHALRGLDEEIENAAAKRGHVIIVETPPAWRTTRIGKDAEETGPDIYADVVAKIAEAKGVSSVKHVASKDRFCSDACMIVVVPKEGADLLDVRRNVAGATLAALALHGMPSSKVAADTSDINWIYASTARVYTADLQARAGDVLLEPSKPLGNSFVTAANMRVHAQEAGQSAEITAHALDDFHAVARREGVQAQLSVVVAEHKSVIFCQLNGEDPAKISQMFRKSLANATSAQGTNGSYIGVNADPLSQVGFSDYELTR